MSYECNGCPISTPEECRAAGAESCEDFLGRLQNRSLKLQDAPGLSPQKRYALQMALQGADLVPPVEAMGLPQPTRPGLYEINTPGPQAPVLVSGNSEITLTVLSAVLATTVSPFYLLLVDTLGDTLDMALIYERFTPAKVTAALGEAHLADKVQHRTLIIPGWPQHCSNPGRGHGLGHPGGAGLRSGTAAIFWRLLAATLGNLTKASSLR